MPWPGLLPMLGFDPVGDYRQKQQDQQLAGYQQQLEVAGQVHDQRQQLHDQQQLDLARGATGVEPGGYFQAPDFQQHRASQAAQAAGMIGGIGGNLAAGAMPGAAAPPLVDDPHTKKKVQDLETKLDTVKMEPSLSDTQRLGLMRDINQQMDGWDPQKQYRKSANPQTFFDKMTSQRGGWITDPESGQRFYALFDGKGTPHFQEIKDRPDRQAEAEQKQQEAEQKRQDAIAKAENSHMDKWDTNEDRRVDSEGKNVLDLVKHFTSMKVNDKATNMERTMNSKEALEKALGSGLSLDQLEQHYHHKPEAWEKYLSDREQRRARHLADYRARQAELRGGHMTMPLQGPFATVPPRTVTATPTSARKPEANAPAAVQTGTTSPHAALKREPLKPIPAAPPEAQPYNALLRSTF